MNFKEFLTEKKKQSGLGAKDTKIVECAQCVYLACISNNIDPIEENFSKVKKYYNLEIEIIEAKQV